LTHLAALATPLELDTPATLATPPAPDTLAALDTPETLGAPVMPTQKTTLLLTLLNTHKYKTVLKQTRTIIKAIFRL